jgi:hypothetical protein
MEQSDMSVFGGPDIITDGLVLHLDAANRKSYPGSGSAWYDLSGNGNNATIVNAAFNSSNNGTIYLDGTDDYVNFGNILNNVLSGNTKFTISVCTKVDQIANVSHHLLSKSGDSNFSENQRQFIFLHRTNGKLEFIYYGAANASIYRLIRANDVTILSGNWYNFTITYDGSQSGNNGLDRVTLYQNAQSLPSSIVNSAGTLTTIPSTTARLGLGAQIGANVNNTPIHESTGLFSNCMIYNRVLSANEVQQNYNALKGRYGL